MARPRKLSESQIQEIAEAYERREKRPDIARKLGVSPGTITRYFRKNKGKNHDPA